MRQIGDLLKDWRRINVSFTRARSKLIIFGSRKTLKTAPLLHEFFELMESRNWILTLPSHAHEMHTVLESAISLKRSVDDADSDCIDPSRRRKKVRKSECTEEGLLNGRYILKDLVNDSR